MIEHNTFEEFYNEFKDWSKKDILKRVYDLINETNKWTDVYLDTMNNQQKEIERLNNRINKAIKKLSSAVNHFHTQRENNVITFTLKILKGSDIKNGI